MCLWSTREDPSRFQGSYEFRAQTCRIGDLEPPAHPISRRHQHHLWSSGDQYAGFGDQRVVVVVGHDRQSRGVEHLGSAAFQGGDQVSRSAVGGDADAESAKHVGRRSRRCIHCQKSFMGQEARAWAESDRWPKASITSAECTN
jgi:hypothetical protein